MCLFLTSPLLSFFLSFCCECFQEVRVILSHSLSVARVHAAPQTGHLGDSCMSSLLAIDVGGVYTRIHMCTHVVSSFIAFISLARRMQILLLDSSSSWVVMRSPVTASYAENTRWFLLLRTPILFFLFFCVARGASLFSFCCCMDLCVCVNVSACIYVIR